MNTLPNFGVRYPETLYDFLYKIGMCSPDNSYNLFEELHGHPLTHLTNATIEEVSEYAKRIWDTSNPPKLFWRKIDAPLAVLTVKTTSDVEDFTTSSSVRLSGLLSKARSLVN